MNRNCNIHRRHSFRHQMPRSLLAVAVAIILWAEPSRAHDPEGDLRTDQLIVLEALDGGMRIAIETKWGRLPSTALLKSADKDGNGILEQRELSSLNQRLTARLVRCIIVTGPTGRTLSPSWTVHLAPGAKRVGPFGLFARAETSIRSADSGAWQIESHCHLQEPGITQIQFRPSRSRHFGKPDILPTPRKEGSLYILPKACSHWRLRVQLLPGGATTPKALSLSHGSTGPTGRLERMVSKPLSFTKALLALLVAFFLGAYHALSPGHGKTLTAAYLVGEQAGMGQAIALAAIVTFTHTFSIALLALGVLLVFGRQVPPSILPYLGAGAGAVIVAVGLHMVFRGAGHHHHHDHRPDEKHQDHSPHDQLRKQAPGDHQDIGHSESIAHRTSAQGRPSESGHNPEGQGATLWRLLTVGITGGMVPCPTALVVLLASLAIGKTLFGLALVAAFSLGLASVLAIIGVLVVRAKDWLEKRTSSKRLTSLLPRASGIVITIVGLVLVLQATR